MQFLPPWSTASEAHFFQNEKARVIIRTKQSIVPPHQLTEVELQARRSLLDHTADIKGRKCL